MNRTKTMHKVSIVIPVYNAEASLLSRTFSGIFSQTEQDFEVVLIDDGSTNHCIERLEDVYKYDSRVTILRQDNFGIEGAIDTGMKTADGRFLYVIGQDDYMHPQTLEYCLYMLNRHDAEFMVFSWHVIHDASHPICNKIGDFDNIRFKVFDFNDAAKSPYKYAEGLDGLNMDAWGHFASMDLARKVHAIWPLYESLSRTNLMQRMAKRWIRSEAKLYYYYNSNSTSLSKRPITSVYIDRNSADFDFLCNLYDRERHNNNMKPIWNTVLEKFILKGVKITVNWYRRHNRRCDKKVNAECVKAISTMLWSLHDKNALPLSKINFRMYIVYRYIMLMHHGNNKRQKALEAKMEQFLHDKSCITEND